jgi:hypothetical protein
MRQLQCFEAVGLTVQDVLDQFNAQAKDELEEKDILSVSVFPPPLETGLGAAGGTNAAQVSVVIVYWASTPTLRARAG